MDALTLRIVQRYILFKLPFCVFSNVEESCRCGSVGDSAIRLSD